MSKNFIHYLVLILASTSFACDYNEKDSNKLIVETDDKLENIGLKIDSIAIPVDNILTYYDIFDKYDYNNEFIYTGYDQKRHSINFINLSNEKVLKTVSLNKEGPQGIGEISGIHCQSKDSIFAISLNNIYLYLFDSNGKIQRKWPINDKDVQHEKFYRFNVFSLSKPNAFHFSTGNKSIYIRNFYYEKSPSTEPKEYFRNANLLGKLDLFENAPSLIPIEYSSTLKDNYVGYLDDPDFVFIDEKDSLKKVIYTFPATADIFSYDMKSNSTTLFKPNSRPIKLHIDYLNWNASNNSGQKLQAVNSDVMYGRIIHIYDQGKSYYVQFCFDKPIQLSINSRTVPYRKVYLVLYDENFNLILSKKLSLYSALYNSAFYQNSILYIPQLKNESELCFLKLSFQFPNP